ncbi:MAG: DUF3604 domain-containing protein [Acidobacteriota bacterium]
MRRLGSLAVTLHTVAGVAFSFLLFAACSPAAAEVGPQLQARVDRLLEEIETDPTTPETAQERAAVLLDWANALSFETGFVPLNSTLVAGRLLHPLPGNRYPARRWVEQLDDFLRRLDLLSQPGKLGSLSIEGPPAVERLSHQTFRVTYTVGELPVVEGGRFLIARQFQSGTQMQVDDPGGDGYVSIASSKASVTFERDAAPIQGPHGGFRAPVDLPAFRLASGELQRGDRVTITYGDTRGGGRGMRVGEYSNDAIALPVYVDHGDGLFHEFPTPTFRVVGGAAAGVHGFAPSIVAVGEEIVVSVRTEDDYYNRATGPIPAYRVLLDGEPYGRIEGASSELTDDYAGALHLLKASFDEPGVYRFTFEEEGGDIVGKANPVLVERDPALRLYWGETHGHCGFAEGQGTADGYFAFGRDDARLDFITLSEHDIWMDDREWQVINDAVDRWSEDGRYIVFPGYEWTSARDTGGHHNVFFRRAGMQRVPTQEAPVLSALYRGLHEAHAEEDVLVIPHAHQAGDWRLSDLGTERLVELVSGHGTFEWFGRYYLEQGFQVGFVGASDDHLGHPGYSPGRSFPPNRSNIFQFGSLAAVFAPAKTHDALFDGLRARSAYAASGAERIILLGSLNGEPMGSSLSPTRSRALELRAIGTAPVDSVTLIRNGEEVETWNFAAGGEGSGRYQIALESDSQPMIRDNPRGHRNWRGRMTVHGARLVEADFNGKRNPSMDRVASEDGAVVFDLATRGLRRTFDFVLEDVQPDARVEIELEETNEAGRAPRVVRPNAMIPAQTISVALTDLVGDGVTEHELPVGRFVDRLQVLRLREDAQDDVSVNWTDPAPTLGGDWYYFRVRQIDGGTAWSSPWWVGLQPPR